MAFAGTLGSRLLARRHTALLVALVVAFSLRPLIGDAGAAPVVFGIAVLVLLPVALYTIQVNELAGERDVLLAERRRRSIVGWTLAVVAIAARLGVIVAPSARLAMAASISWLLFFSFVTWSEVRSVLQQKQVTSETISMAICAYLLLGLTWGLLYIVMFERQPGAFNFGESRTVTSLADEQEYFPLLIYFSLTTLTTLGFGDITPVTLQARYAAVAEGITGQLYLAILVARLVGMRLMSRSVDPGGRPPLAARRNEGPVRSVLRVPRRRGSRVRSRRTRA
jgi:hypothetical protein